ncbi:MAG: hypothetical protein KDF56_08380, partial [Ottowia sp.]|nr:hypothetical protein [Ottowia sp.]
MTELPQLHHARSPRRARVALWLSAALLAIGIGATLPVAAQAQDKTTSSAAKKKPVRAKKKATKPAAAPAKPAASAAAPAAAPVASAAAPAAARQGPREADYIVAVVNTEPVT